MDRLLCGPHLWPSLPSYVSEALDSAQARLMGLLNLSLDCAVLACYAVVVPGLVRHLWPAALAVAIGSSMPAWLGYQAAVSQTLEETSQIRAAFNLYRHAILTQMGLAIPDDIATERARWQSMTMELLGEPPDAAPSGDRAETAAAATDGRTEPAARENG